MNYPEILQCSSDEHEDGKEFLVAPGRLCRDGLYSLRALTRYTHDPERGGLIVPAKINEIHEERARLHVVTYTVEAANLSDEERDRKFKMLMEGDVAHPVISGIKEGYFAHRFDETDSELHAIRVGAELRETIEQLAEKLDPYMV